MEGLAVIDGDLALSGSNLLTVTGSARVRQDLDIALHDPYNSDPMHPYWGSILDRFIGSPITPAVEQQVINEVRRVVNNYISVQADMLSRTSLTGARSTMSTRDIVTGISSLTVRVTMDTIRVNLTLETMARESISIVREVTV